MSTKPQLPICTIKLNHMSEEQYESLIEDGYVEIATHNIVYENLRGRYVKLIKPMGCCERTARVFGGIVIFPFACIITVLSCCAFDAVQYDINNLCGPGMDGGDIESGFIENPQETAELWKKDFEELGCEDFIDLAKSRKFPAIQSSNCPQHYFIPFHGPYSNLSFIIIIPDGDYDRAQFFPVFDENKRPCNADKMIQYGEIICAGYKPGVKKIKTVTERVLVKQAKSNNPFYGSVDMREYEIRKKVISS